MALEIREVTINGQAFKIQEMCFDDAEAYSEGSGKLVARIKKGEDVPIKEFNDRNIEAVCNAIRNSGDSDMTPAKLRKECGLRGVRILLDALIELSGLKVASPGEEKAA